MAAAIDREYVGLGIVGLGYWGPNLLRAGRSAAGSRVVAACDSDPEIVSRMEAMNPGLPIVTEMSQLLENPSVDAIVIATPAASHASLARTVLEAGLHVLVEKPLALTSRECLDLADLAERSDLTLMVGHTFLYSAPVNALRKLVQEGELGKPYYASCRRLNMGRVRSDVNALWNFAPHDVSILEYTFDSMPIQVSASGGAYLQPGVEDVVFLTLAYADGMVASIELSWLSPIKRREITLVGDKRMIVYDDAKADGPLTIHDRGFSCLGEAPSFDGFGGHALTRRLGDTLVPHVPLSEPLVVQMEDFVDCITSKNCPISNAWHGARVVSVLEAADRALRSRRAEPVAMIGWR